MPNQNKSAKRVLMLAYARYFTDARIKSYVRVLLEQGIGVDLVCLRDPYSTARDDKDIGVNLIFAQSKYQGKSAFRYLISYLSFALVSFVIVSVRYLRQRYRTVHVHNMPDFLVFCAIVPKLFGAQIILDMHDVMVAGVLNKFSNEERGLLFHAARLQSVLSVRFVDTLICADDSQKEFLKEHGIIHPKTIVLMNLPSSRVFRRRSVTPDRAALKLIYHGTIAKRLGLDLVIQAVEEVATTTPVTLTIVGDGDYKRDLMRYCSEHGLIDKQVFFKPSVPVEQLQPEVEQYTAGIIGNRRSLQAEKCMLPVKLMEYLFIGLPVVAPRLSVINRYFGDEMIYFYEPENVEEMARRIIELYSDPDEATKMVENARSFFEKHNWSYQARDYLRIVSENFPELKGDRYSPP